MSEFQPFVMERMMSKHEQKVEYNFVGEWSSSSPAGGTGESTTGLSGTALADQVELPACERNSFPAGEHCPNVPGSNAGQRAGHCGCD